MSMSSLRAAVTIVVVLCRCVLCPWAVLVQIRTYNVMPILVGERKRIQFHSSIARPDDVHIFQCMAQILKIFPRKFLSSTHEKWVIMTASALTRRMVPLSRIRCVQGTLKIFDYTWQIFKIDALCSGRELSINLWGNKTSRDLVPGILTRVK